jgi:hypothetical protein
MRLKNEVRSIALRCKKWRNRSQEKRKELCLGRALMGTGRDEVG